MRPAGPTLPDLKWDSCGPRAKKVYKKQKNFFGNKWCGNLEEGLFGEFLIDFGSVGDVLGAVGVVERRQRLLEIGSGR